MARVEAASLLHERTGCNGRLAGMRATIDGAGRLVVPKQLRDALGFTSGQELELNAVGGKLEVELPATEMRLEEDQGDLVAGTDQPMPTLTAALVRDTLERVRR